MLRSKTHQPDPKLDLVLERVVDVSPERIWAAWTQPELLKQWFCPLPWKTIEAEIDLRPGGIFRTVMQSPEGEKFPNLGCYLEVVPNEKLVWTDGFGPGFRPKKECTNPFGTFFTAIIALEPRGSRTLYTATGVHVDVESCKKHAAMGFHEGWGICLDQLVALMK